MATFKIFPANANRKNSDEYISIVIRVTHNRQLAYIPTGINLPAKLLKKGEVADPHTLSVLNARIMKYNQYVIDMSASLKYMSAKELKDALIKAEDKELRPQAAVVNNKGIDLLAFWRDEFLRTTKTVKTRNLYKTSMNRLAKYTGKELYTSDINLRFLLAYERHLQGDGVGQRGVNLYMTHFKRVFNYAKDLYNDEDTGDILIPNNPFAKYKVPAAPLAKRQGHLTREQLLSIINYKPQSIREELGKDCFLMSLFLAGINSADLYHIENLSPDWVLSYYRRKTMTRRADHAEQRITVPEYIRPLFKKYKDKTQKRLLNLHLRYAGTPELNAAINKGLKSIGKAVGISDLYYYRARHSFATIARNKLHFSLEDVGESLTHAPVMRTTLGYVEDSHEVTDRINTAVMNYILHGTINEKSGTDR